jgi:phage gp36-like protein
MGYCTVANIKSDFKGLQVETSGTTISTDEAQEIIDQTSAYIDGRIGVKYVTPVTEGAAALLILKAICIYICSERFKNILEVKTGAAQMDSDQKQSKNIARTPKDDIDLIVKGLLLLDGATLQGTKQGVSSFNSDECIEHVIDVTKQQW